MLHPATELRFISDDVGYGVVATQRIPRGTITWVHDDLDRTFTPAEVDAMPQIYRKILDKYSFRDNRGNCILCWDHARFVNHSFRSNCISTAYDFEIAVRDIEPGEELTDDYGYLNIDEPFEALPEKGSRRKLVMPDDLLHYYKQWDRQLTSAFRRLEAVPQPLMELLSPEIARKARAIAAGREKMDSILSLYWTRGEDGPRLPSQGIPSQQGNRSS